MGAHDFRLNKVPFLARFVSRFAAPKLALVPANQYICDIKLSYFNVCTKFY